MDSETDPQALAERVNELEETVAQLMGVSRRDVLFGAGAIGATAMAGGSLLSQSAAASESVGQVGAPDRRVDVFSDLVDANSVSTDSASIGKTPTENDEPLRWQEGCEVGVVTADGVDNSAGDDTWGQAATSNATVSFDTSFLSPPKVVCTLNDDFDNADARGYYFNVKNTSTTGFDIDFFQMTAVDNSGLTDAYAVTYLATEGR